MLYNLKVHKLKTIRRMMFLLKELYFINVDKRIYYRLLKISCQVGVYACTKPKCGTLKLTSE